MTAPEPRQGGQHRGGAPSARLRLVGQVRLVGRGGADLTPRGAKAQGILVLVGSAPNLRRTRAFLQDKLWSDRGAEQGSASLRQSLVELRRCLGEYRDCLLTDARSVALDGARIRVVMAPEAEDWGPLHEVPEFAAGLDIVDPEFEDWIRDQRSAFADWMAREARDETFPPAAARLPAGVADPGEDDPVQDAPRRDAPREDEPERTRPLARVWRRLSLAAVLLPLLVLSFLGFREATTVSTGIRGLPGAEAAVVPGPSIAVLPFESLASDPAQRDYARVVAREIVTSLAQFPYLFVVDADAGLGGRADQATGPAAPVDVGHALGVRYVLRGLVQRTEGLIRANVQLIQTDNGRTMWATRIEGDAGDAFVLQDEIARAVVVNLRPMLDPACGALAPGAAC